MTMIEWCKEYRAKNGCSLREALDAFHVSPDRDAIESEATKRARINDAAPDMLDVLRRLVTYYAGETRPEAIFKLDAARAAIAKAEGRAA